MARKFTPDLNVEHTGAERTRSGVGRQRASATPVRRGTIAKVTSRPASAQRLRDLARLRRVRDRIDREYAQPPAVDPGITDDERRTIFEMMALITNDLDGTLRAAAGQRRRGRTGADGAAVRGSRLRLPRSCGNLIRIQELR